MCPLATRASLPLYGAWGWGLACLFHHQPSPSCCPVHRVLADPHPLPPPVPSTWPSLPGPRHHLLSCPVSRLGAEGWSGSGFGTWEGAVVRYSAHVTLLLTLCLPGPLPSAGQPRGTLQSQGEGHSGLPGGEARPGGLCPRPARAVGSGLCFSAFSGDQGAVAPAQAYTHLDPLPSCPAPSLGSHGALRDAHPGRLEGWVPGIYPTVTHVVVCVWAKPWRTAPPCAVCVSGPVGGDGGAQCTRDVCVWGLEAGAHRGPAAELPLPC